MIVKRFKFRAWSLLAIGSFGVAAAAGCANGTTESDVNAARDRVEQERQETAEARREASEDVGAAVEQRRETLKVDASESAERAAAEEVREESEEGASAILEEQRETQEAERDLQETQAEFAATKQRDAFLEQSRMRLDDAQKRIDALREEAADAEGARRDALDANLERLTELHDQAEESLAKIRSEEVRTWVSARPAAVEALDRLFAELEQAD